MGRKSDPRIKGHWKAAESINNGQKEEIHTNKEIGLGHWRL